MGCSLVPEIKVDAVVNLAGTGKPNFPVSPTHSGGSAISTLNTYSYTSSGTEPSSPKNGAIWWDSANDKVMVYINGEFKEISLNTDYPIMVIERIGREEAEIIQIRADIQMPLIIGI